MASDWINRPLPDLDLYLAQSFRGYPSVWAQLVARGVDPDVTEQTWRRIFDMQTARKLEAYTNVFGPPAEVRDDSYLWSLTLWPDHQWLVAFYDRPDWDILNACEIVRREPGRPERVSPLNVDAALGALRLGYDTTAEVRAALGDGQRFDGWWPWESWEYDVPDGSALQCVFIYNILVAITPERL